MKKPIEIFHRPFGDHHPYKSGADERIPRQPGADQTVRIGILTTPIGAALNVWITYWIDDQCEQKEKTTATHEGSISDDFAFTEDGHLSEAAARDGLIFGVDQWAGLLPAFPGGTKVYYQLILEAWELEIQSQVYNYTVRKEIPLDTITSILHGQNSLVLILENRVEKVEGYLLFHNPAENHMQIAAVYGKFREEEMYETVQVTQTGSTSIVKRFGETIIQVDPNATDFQIIHQGDLVIKGYFAPGGDLGNDRFETAGLSFECFQDESFYGFGERFNALDQRGQRLDVRVYDQYKNQGTRTYLPVPLLVSSRGYGLLVNSSRFTVFDLAQKNSKRWTTITELGDDNSIKYDLLLGSPDNLIDIVCRLNNLTGKPVLPPDWAFGLWMSSNEWNTQARVEEMLAYCENHEIPASVMVLEAWSDENTFYIWNDARYSPKPGAEEFCLEDFTFPSDGMWPDPKGMVEKLHQHGLRLLLWQIPVVKVNEDDHAQLANDREHMLEQGYCVETTSSSPYLVRPYWFRDGYLMDFTNEDGVDWWMRKRGYLLEEIGIDGFKTDGGEHIWGPDLKFADGKKSDEIWNEYPNQYSGAYFKFSRNYKPDAITFSRAGFTGAQAYPCHWAGDENSTWGAFQRSILAGLNAGISGIPFWGWDFAGFSGEIPTAELYLRAAAMAVFCPIMQYHSEFNHHRQPCNDRTPWNIAQRTNNPEVLNVFRYLARLRMNLLPYILHTARQSAEKGLPMMKALCLVFPQDANLEAYPYQYMFGDSILVAPIVQPDLLAADVYLPEGVWYSFWDDRRYPGGSVYSIPTSIDRIPVFVRANSLIPLYLNDCHQLGSELGKCEGNRNTMSCKLYPTTKYLFEWTDGSGQDVRIAWEEKSPNQFVMRVLDLFYPSIIILPEDFRFASKSADESFNENILYLTDSSQKSFEVSGPALIGGI